MRYVQSMVLNVTWILLARHMNVDLTQGYLFRPTTPDLGIQNSGPLTSSAAKARLNVYLQEMNTDEGETLHQGFARVVRSHWL